MAAIDFPASPAVNQLFVAPNGVTYQWTGVLWLPVGGTTALSVGDTPPASPGANALWWNSTSGMLYIWYNDGNTTQWVPATPTLPVGVIAPGTVLWRMYDEKVLAVSTAVIDLSVPVGCKQFQIDFDLGIVGGANDNLLMYCLQSGAPYTTADQSAQQIYGAGASTGAQVISPSTALSLANAIYFEGRIMGSLAPTFRTTFFAHAVVAELQAAGRVIRSSEIDNGCLRSTITGFRLRTTATNFAIGSTARVSVLS